MSEDVRAVLAQVVDVDANDPFSIDENLDPLNPAPPQARGALPFGLEHPYTD